MTYGAGYRVGCRALYFRCVKLWFCSLPSSCIFIRDSTTGYEDGILLAGVQNGKGGYVVFCRNNADSKGLNSKYLFLLKNDNKVQMSASNFS